MYWRLYAGGALQPEEKAVLGCFLLEGLNECIQDGHPHLLQHEIFAALFADRELHAAELAYWMDTQDPDPENWWPITSALLDYRRMLGLRG